MKTHYLQMHDNVRHSDDVYWHAEPPAGDQWEYWFVLSWEWILRRCAVSYIAHAQYNREAAHLKALGMFIIG